MRTPKSFILLEVIISLVIVSLTISAIMRCFSVSIQGLRNSEIVTTGTILAQELLNEFEIKRPDEDEIEADFAEDGFPDYYFKATFEEVEVDYPSITLEAKVDDFTNLTKVTIEVYYDNQRSKVYRAARIETFLSGIERFSYESKKENRLY